VWGLCAGVGWGERGEGFSPLSRVAVPSLPPTLWVVGLVGFGWESPSSGLVSIAVLNRALGDFRTHTRTIVEGLSYRSGKLNGKRTRERMLDGPRPLIPLSGLGRGGSSSRRRGRAVQS